MQQGGGSTILMSTTSTTSHNQTQPKPPSKQKYGAVASIFTFASLGGFLFGYDIGATTFANTSLQSLEKAGVSWGAHLETSSLLRGFFVSSAVGGALLGTFVVLRVEQKIGRRKELLLASLLYGVGALLEFLSAFITESDLGLVVILIGRWIYGAGIAFAMHAAPAYIAEMSPPSIRGLLVAAKEGMIVLGILCAQIAGYVARETEGGWKWTFFLALPLAVVMGVGMWFLPPSGRWLALQGRWEEAEASLRYFMRSGIGGAMEEIRSSVKESERKRREGLMLLASAREEEGQEEGGGQDGSGGEENGSNNNNERGSASTTTTSNTTAKNMKNTTTPQTNPQTKEQSLLRNPKYRWPLLVGLGVVTLQQISGQPSVLYYANELLDNVGVAASATLLVGAFKLLATLAAVFTVDRAGRRTLLLVGIGLMLVALAILTTAFHFYGQQQKDNDNGDEKGGNKTLDILLIGGLFLYIAGYQAGFGPVSWILVSEIFPLEVRGQAVAMAVLVNFFFNLIVTLVFDSLREWMGTSGTFALFLVVGVGAWGFVYMCLPETKGLSLEMVEVLFASGKMPGSVGVSVGGGGQGQGQGGGLHQEVPPSSRRPRRSSGLASIFYSWFGRPRSVSVSVAHSHSHSHTHTQYEGQGGGGGGSYSHVLPFIEGLLPVEKKDPPSSRSPSSALKERLLPPSSPSLPGSRGGSESKVEGEGGNGGGGGGGGMV